MSITEMDKLTRHIKLQEQQEFKECWYKVKQYLEDTWALKIC